jgi:hypothetical protein
MILKKIKKLYHTEHQDLSFGDGIREIKVNTNKGFKISFLN